MSNSYTGKVYMVPTPVGNMLDMTPRAITVLNESDIILAEDTRTSSVLLKHFGINTPLQSFHKFNEHKALQSVVEMISSGKIISVISDAGTPGISDPGFLIARECRKLDIPVETLPGPTAFVPAIIDSGLPCERFCFEGFLPQKKGRETRLKEIANEQRTSIIYESPLRLVKTLQQLACFCGEEREASVSREISKIHETTVRGTLNYLIDYFSENNPKGEIVIVLSGAPVERSVHVNKFKTENKNQ